MSLWSDFIATHPQCAGENPATEKFGDSVAMANELLDLVRSGIKRATAGAVADFGDEPLPGVGTHWVVTDGSDVPQLVLRTTQVRTGPLDSVDDAFAWDEGEGDRTRDWWLDAHRRYFRRSMDLAVDADVDSLATVFERFIVVWPPESADGTP